MSYPTTLPQHVSSRRIPRAGFDAQRMSNGTLRLRSMYPSDKHDFEIVHWLSAAQLSTLMLVYTTNRLANVTLTWQEDGSTYTCRFTERPSTEWTPGYIITRVKLSEV